MIRRFFPAFQPRWADLQGLGQKMEHAAPGYGFAADVLAHMAFSQFNAGLFRLPDQIYLFQSPLFHGSFQTVRKGLFQLVAS